MKNPYVMFFGIFLLGAILYPIAFFGTETEVRVTVTEKERVVSSSRDNVNAKYLIFTDKGTFENTDTILYGKFNSSDIYGKLKENQEYTFTVVGWRIPFLSSYQNIIEVQQ